MTGGMSFLRRLGTILVAATVALASAAAGGSGGSGFGVRPALEAPEPSGFDALRKPPIPVSFLSHDGGWIQFQYPPSARDRVGPLIAQADDLRAELAEDLGQTPLDGIEIRVARGSEEMVTLAPQGASSGSATSGLTYPKMKLIVLSLGTVGAPDPIDLGDGFRRELARLALQDAVGGSWLPSWFVERFARHFGRDADWDRGWTLYRAAVRHRTYTTSELDYALEKGGAGAALALAQGTDFVGYLLKPERRTKFSAAIERLRQGEAFDAALAAGYGTDLLTLEREWRGEVQRRATLVTILVGVGVPALLLVAWGVFRAIRRRRVRLRAPSQSIEKASRSGASSEAARVHIVLSRRDERMDPPVIAESEIPKVEHEGQWHTLH